MIRMVCKGCKKEPTAKSLVGKKVTAVFHPRGKYTSRGDFILTIGGAEVYCTGFVTRYSGFVRE